MHNSSKVARNRTSSAVPAPFIPSSVPGTDLHWRKAANRKAKAGKPRAASAGVNTDRRIKNRTTEYEDKFVEWDLPQRDDSPSKRNNAPTGFYERDLNAFDWKSEQKRSFNQKDIGHGGGRAAGVPRGVQPGAAIWYAEDEIPHLSGTAGGSNARPASAGRRSEHVSKYNWPTNVERTHSAKPPASVKSSPLAADPDALLHGAELWKSEYDAQCAELRRKQKELLAHAPSIAGVPSVAHDNIPTFYAWEEDESRPRQAVPHPVVPGSKNWGTSEYKMKFVEFPLPEHQRSAKEHVESDHLNLFHEDHPEAPHPERSASVLHQDYPGHDVTHVGRATSPARAREDHIPKSFAWPLADGSLPPADDGDEPDQTRLRRRRANNLVAPNNASSEYTRSFTVPPHEAYLNRPHPEKPIAGKALDLFAEDAAASAAEERRRVHERLTSENHAQFHAFPDAPTPTRVTASTRAAGLNQNYPTQFAWSLVNGGEQPLESPARPKRPLQPNQDMSEYTRMFNWPPPVEQPQAHRSSAPGPTAAEALLGRDATSLGGKEWRSEYDQQCAELRRKLDELRTNGGNQHVAGVPTKAHDAYPTNYAWEVPPPPAPTDVPREPRTEVVRSEYEESFKQWPLAKPEIVHPKVDANTLNLFREEASAESKATEKSEYAEKFHAFDSTTAARPPIASATRGLPLPPQFAWPRVEPPQPPTEHVKPANEVRFAETSEYDSKFTWPKPVVPAPDAVAPVRVAAGGAPTSVILPIPDKEGAPQQWVSEYGAHAADAVHKEDVRDQPAAGRVTVVQKDIPHFYAWRETELPPPAPKPVVPRYHGEPVHSEYDDAFKAWPVPEVAVRPKASGRQQTLNILTDTSNLTAPADSLKSEYDAQFVPHTADEVKSLENPYKTTKSSAVEVPKPPQFAWPLVDGAPHHESTKPTPSADAPHSEYETQFVWRGFDTAEISGRRGPKANQTSEGDETGAALTTAAKTRAVLPATAPIPLDAAAMRTSDWRSEYDDQCATLRKKQEELNTRAALPVAGIHSIPTEQPPAFYAYGVQEEKKPEPARDHAGKDVASHEITEYEANYKPWPVKTEEVIAEHQRAAATRMKETFKAFQFGKDRSFRGVSEYDDQFSPKSVAEQHHAPHELSAAMDAKYSCKNPIVPPPPSTVAAAPVRPKTAPVSGRTKGPKLTETSANFQWPDKSRLSGSAVPVRSTHKVSTVLGVPDAVVRRARKDPKAPLFVSARHAVAEGDAFAESDFQSSSSETKESSAADEGSKQGDGKYRLMSQEIRDRRNGGHASRSDYTTGVGVLNASARSADATVSRTAPGGGLQHFHISRQFSNTPGASSTAASLQGTGLMSTDSLGPAGAPSSKLATAGSITGLRFPEQPRHQLYRARSVPHRQRLAVANDSASHKPAAKIRYAADDTDNNPVLMNKRYPYVSKKQLGRWSTETGDAFRWRKKSAGLNTSHVSLASH